MKNLRATRPPMIYEVLGRTLLLALMASACGAAPYQPPVFDGESHGPPVRIHLVPIPEGPGVSVPTGSIGPKDSHRLLASLAPYFPDPFPLELDQPANCTIGGDLVVTFADSTRVTYGPCNRPASID